MLEITHSTARKRQLSEQFNRTLKTLKQEHDKMYRAFSVQDHYRWLSLLPILLKKYDNIIHRTIGMKPCEINDANQHIVIERIKKNTTKNMKMKKNKFNIGDRVRISKDKTTFAKGYSPYWTNEIYTVHRLQPTVPVTYLLIDHTAEVLKCGFYEIELNKSVVDDVYLVEQVLQLKGDCVRVRWLCIDGKHDSWIPKTILI